MRRSPTTVSPAIVRRRLQGEKLLQNNTDTSNPSNPPTIRMIPTVLRLNPEPVSASTTPPRTLLGCRQGCYRQAVPLSKERHRLSGRYGQHPTLLLDASGLGREPVASVGSPALDGYLESTAWLNWATA